MVTVYYFEHRGEKGRQRELRTLGPAKSEKVRVDLKFT